MSDPLSDPISRSVRVDEVRVLDGPNLYFARPAVKISLALPGYLELDRASMVGLAERVGLRRPRPGRPRTEQRQRFVMRLAAHVTRLIAAEVGVQRLTVRSRAGAAVDEIDLAVPWRHRTWARLLGESVAPVLDALLTADVDRSRALIAAAGAQIRDADPGPGSSVIEPTVPVVSITGTNGKTTTTRLVAHIAMTAGLTTAWSSTSGVVVMGRTVESGDYSGPAGARAVLETPGLQLGVLETARGGMLLRGMGVASNDVSVVTNVTADHLGLQGIHTLDQLAEVKAIVTTVTKPSGWVVLNGDDPRVWPMRHRIKARPWAFSPDPDSPSLRESLAVGGRGITVLDGVMVVLTAGADPDRLTKVVDVPATLAGLSRHNVSNALAAAAAALGLGIPRAAVVEGLRTFLPDPVLNEGRLNVYTLPLASQGADGGSATVILDLAHNEAGVEALLEVARGLAAPGARVHAEIGATGDRAQESEENLAEVAGRMADHVVIAHKPKYFRGRTQDELDQWLRVGLTRAGVAEVVSYDDEMQAIEALGPQLSDGDVLAFICHDHQDEVRAWVADHGGTSDDPRTIRRKVVAARGEHELEPEIAALWELADADERVARAAELHAGSPRDLRLVFEWASALDAAGRAAEALPHYREAVDAGLREPFRHRALLQAASGLRVTGQPDAALELLDEVEAGYPGNASATALRALTLHDLGRDDEAVARLVESLVEHATDDDMARYRPALRRYAGELGALGR